MPQFRFRLATLLRLREATRNRRRAELASALREDTDLQEHLTRLSAEWKRLEDDRRKAAGPGEVKVAELVVANRYAAAMRAQVEELRRKRQTLAAEIEHRRQELFAADRDVKVLEKLREHRLERHCYEEERQSAKQLDEAAAQSVGR